METEIRILEELKVQLTKSYTNFKKTPKERLTKNYAEVRQEILEQSFKNFSSKYEILVGEYGASKLSNYFKEDVFESVSELYLNFKVDIKKCLSTFREVKLESGNASSDKSNPIVKLPKIKIPTFSGNYIEWCSFRDLFISLIHNNSSLDNVQRLHYLRSQLSGEAEQLIKNIPITDNNYKQCWEMLVNRYNNKKYLSTCILKRLFDQPRMLIESARSLKNLVDVTNDCLHELKNLGIDVKSWDILVIYVVSLKLDVDTRKQWELHASQSSEDLPSFKLFKEFIETRYRALEFVEPKCSKPKLNNYSNKSNPKVLHISKLTCPHCSDEHKLFNCKKFAAEDSDKRRDIAQSLGVCFNCLGPNHSSKNCRIFTKCRICQRRHHTLLHPKGSGSSAVGTPTDSSSAHVNNEDFSNRELSSNIATHFLNENAENQVLLATALIGAESKDGSTRILRTLLDQGSQASFITEAAVQLLRLKKVATKTTINGIGGGKHGVVSRHVVSINIHSLHDCTFSMPVTAHVLTSLTSVMPDKTFKLDNWPELLTVKLADPKFNTPNKVDVLLGAEAYCRILKEGLIRGPKGSPVAQDTYLGWIVSGQVNSEECSHNYQHNAITSMHAQVDENDMLKRLWELDAEPSLVKKPLSLEEEACEEHYKATTQRDESGRYVVRLPFRCKDPPCKYGKSKAIATKRFLGLERKLANNKELKREYSDVIKEYLLLGHLEKISNELDRTRSDVVYLPHHAVVREDKLTTKVRVVYDASCKGTNGVSLNDTLMVGPTLQADLRHIVLRWRQHSVCLAADIVKMYRQVKIAQEDTDFQRIVWRESPTEDIEDFRLLTVTFGTSCAPYLAVKSLQQLACDEGKIYPLAADRVMSDFYMDDLMTGCQSETEALNIYKEMNSLLEKGGFKLQKWTSNKSKLLEELKEDAGRDLEIKLDKVTKVLGLTWNRNTDEFDYTVKMSPPAAPETKRTVISEISRLYDPLGWIAPCIITSKVFIQKLWISGIDWDDELPPELLQEWKIYREELERLLNFHIPRWIGKSDSNVTIELHGFGDASNVAYAAAVYCRVVDGDGTIYSNLITAKTKVAPIKQISIPRLELNGAVLAAKLLTEVANVMDIPKSNLHAWTDSSVVLAWLSDHPSRWKTYVANRTSEVLCLLDNTQWAHVQSKDNPADIASRGALPADLLTSDLWKHGPKWLRSESIKYSKPVAILTNEEKKTVQVHTANVQTGFDNTFTSKFSSLTKLKRVLAYCRRFSLFAKRCSNKGTVKPYLTTVEIEDALLMCIRNTQEERFHAEIRALKNDQLVSKKSSLYTLTPFIDNSGLLRVGGRIRHSQLPENTKHPIVIPHDTNLAKLIVSDAHERTFHGGPQLVLNFIRSKYWISRLKTLIRSHIHSCVPCIRYTASTKQQLMGDLPACRITPSKPFLNSGVDYAGPINMRVTKGRGHRAYKGYICLFVCMATRAVHIEAVSDLTTEGFLAAFKRFVSRRGHCRHIWSDNGTNFVGAARELKMLFDQESSMMKNIAEALVNFSTEWHFIPPHAPNFGGLWEAGIKSAKFHLKRVVGDSTLTYEEMSTVLTQVEACLNSRPLSQVSTDPEDPTPLTPGHFLVGHPLVVPPDYNYESTTLSTLRRWQLVQRMVQHFWRRWQQEYLTHFFHRYKWNVITPELKVDDVVLVKEDNLPPAKWLYGRVIELHPGKDSLTRVVTLRCRGTTFTRPISKLCILPVTD